MMPIAKELKKLCPHCGSVNKAYEAEVLPNGEVVYRFLCSGCGFRHVKYVEAKNVTVEALVGFKSKPLRWAP